jgi:hypothetical protein
VSPWVLKGSVPREYQGALHLLRPNSAALRRRIDVSLALCWVGACAVLMWVVPAWAGPKEDAASRRAIAAAMEDYAKTKDADAADGALLEAISVCGKDCRAAVLAQAWMYIGVVKGGGKNDWDTAREAFSVALGFDDKVALDPRFFNPTAQALFDGIKNQQKAPDASPAEVVAGFEPGTQMGCFPLVQEVEAFRPIPISCSTKVQSVDGVVLRYRQYGDENWTRIDLKKVGDDWRGEIPCAALDRPGTWGMYVEAKDQRDNTLERIGARDKPLVFKVVEKSSLPPPSLPGEPPPDKCVQSAYCPEEMVGTPACEALKGGAAGGQAKDTTCKQTSDCDLGMSCLDGRCKGLDVCTEDKDCGSEDMCKAGLCVERPRASKLDWFGFHFGADFASLSGSSDACEPQDGGEFACFDGSEAYDGTPYPGNGGTVSGGFHAGTMRVMFSYDRFLLENVSLGARFGFAFSGAPDGFFPLHFEARGTYYFGNVTQGRSRFVPYVAVGAGLAQVDSKVPVQMVDCLPTAIVACTTYPQVDEQLVNPNGGAARLRTLDAYKSLGTVFGSLSPGLMVAVSKELSAVANLGVLLMTDQENSTSLVIDVQPSLGVELGF